MQKIHRLLLLLPLIAALNGCFLNAAERKSKFSKACQSTDQLPNYYVASMATTEDEKKTVSEILSALARSESRQIVIDQVKDDRLHTLYSSEHNRRAIQGISKRWSIAPVNEQGMIAPFQRLHTLGDLYGNTGLQAYIITSGTSDPQALAKIRSAANELKGFACLQVNVLGLDSSHRLKMSEALHPLGKRLEFSSNNRQEWQKKIDTK